MLLNFKCAIYIWPIIFVQNLSAISTFPLEGPQIKGTEEESITTKLPKNQHNQFNPNDTSKHHNEPIDVKLYANNSEILMAASDNGPSSLYLPNDIKPRGFRMPNNRSQPLHQYDATPQTSSQNYHNNFFPKLPSLEHSLPYYSLTGEPIIAKFLPHQTKEFQPGHIPLSTYDVSILGSGDFGVLRGGTFYSEEEPFNDEGSDFYYGDTSNTHGVSSTEGFIQKYTYPEEQFAHFRDFADLETPVDSEFSQYVVVYANKNSTNSRRYSKPKNIFEQLQEIDKEKALEEKKSKKNYTTTSSITKLKLVKTKQNEKKWVQKQPFKIVDDDPLIALS